MNLWLHLVVVASLTLWLQLRGATASKGFGWKEQNCSAELHIPLLTSGGSFNHKYESNNSRMKDSQTFSQIELNSNECPPWYQYTSQNGTCSFTRSLHGRVSYVRNTLQTVVLQCYCMTNDSATHELAISACPYTCLVSAGYYTLPCNASKVENSTCGRFKRRGVGCGDCAPGFAPPACSYSSHCVNCSHVNFARNLIKYLAITYVPLTIFTLIIIVFQVKATSPYLFSYIFIVQTMTQTVNMRFFQTLLEDRKIHSSEVTKWGISLLSVWNLDFFRLHYTPFCLHSEMTTLLANFLELFVALYPLLLIAALILLVGLGIGRTRLSKIVCSPVNRLCYHYCIDWDLHSNLVSAFATFILLSNEKILSVSFDMLLPTYVYPMNESTATRLHVFSSGTVEYFSREHISFALCSILFVVVLVIVPMILLLFYPFAFFRRWLRKIHLDSDAVRSFVNHFYEGYKNKNEDGADYRWFPVLYFILRFVLLLLYGASLSSFFFPMVGIVLTTFLVFLAVVRPRKSEGHNRMDMFHIVCFLIFILGVMANITANSQTKRKVFLRTSVSIISISACLPTLYLFGLISYFVLFRMRIASGVRRMLQLYIRIPFRPRDRYERIVNNYGSFDSIPDHFVHADNQESHVYVPQMNKSVPTFPSTDT